MFTTPQLIPNTNLGTFGTHNTDRMPCDAPVVIPDARKADPHKADLRDVLPDSTADSQEKVFPFHDPSNLRVDDWETDLVSTDSMYVMLSGQSAAGGKDLDTIVKEGRVPVLCITATLYREIRYLVERNAHSELAMFLTMKRLHETKPVFLAFDFFMPGQEASSGGVSLDAKDCRKYFNALKDIPYYKENGLHRNLCHLHSHGNLEAFWSSIDDAQQFSKDDLGFMDDYRLYAVVNAAGEIKCSLVTYVPVVTRVDAVVAVSFSRPSHIEWLSKKRKAELDALFKEMVAAKTVSGPGRSIRFGSDIFDKEYLEEFGDFRGYGATVTKLARPGKTVTGDAAATNSTKCAVNAKCAGEVKTTTDSSTQCDATARNTSELANFLYSVAGLSSGDAAKLEKDVVEVTGEDWYKEARKAFINTIAGGAEIGTYDVEKASALFSYAMTAISSSSLSYERKLKYSSGEMLLADSLGKTMAEYMLCLADMFEDPEPYICMIKQTYTDFMSIEDPATPSEDVARIITQCDQLYAGGGDTSCSDDVLNAIAVDMQYILKWLIEGNE